MRGESSSRRFFLSASAMLIVFALAVTPVLALTSMAVMQKLDTEIAPETDSRSIVFVPADNMDYGGVRKLVSEDSLTLDTYPYSQSGWSIDSQQILPAMGAMRVNRRYGSTTSSGWLGNYTTYPFFYDVTNSTMGEWNANLTDTRYLFGLQLGVSTFVLAEENEVYYGTLTIPSGVEFIHLVVAGDADFIDTVIEVIDPMGRIVSYWEITDGDIVLMPFVVPMPGEYLIRFQTDTDEDIPLPVTFTPSSIAPTTIADGEVVQGTVHGAEAFVDQETGEFVWRERIPDVHTYKVSSEDGLEGLLRFTSRIGQFWGGDVIFLVQAPVFTSFGSMPQMYNTFLSDREGRYYYNSFQGESYYISTFGFFDESEYTISNELMKLPDLPTNTPVYIEEISKELRGYRFFVSNPTLLRINYTSIQGGFGLKLWTVDDTMMYRSLEPTISTTFQNAPTYYLKPGQYILTYQVTSLSSGFAKRIFQFNTGLVTSSGTGIPCELHGLAGFRTTLDQLQWSNFNISLMSHDNVSLSIDFDIYNEYGLNIYSSFGKLNAYRENGVWGGYMATENRSSIAVPYKYTDGDVILAMAIYDAQNNTGVLVPYSSFTGTFDVTPWNRETSMVSQGIVSVSSGATQVFNFTLEGPPVYDSLDEYYTLEMNITPGRWMNLSIDNSMVADWDMTMYHIYDGWHMYLPYSDLDDFMVGSVAGESAYEFGTISNRIKIYFHVIRSSTDEGFFEVTLEELQTVLYNTYGPPDSEIVPGPGEAPVDLALLGVGVGGAAIAIVVIVYVLKRRGSAE